MANKTEIKRLPVEKLRALLNEHFDGIEEDTTKEELIKIVDDHWDEGLEETLEGYEVEGQAPEAAPGSNTDLYTGRTLPR